MNGGPRGVGALGRAVVMFVVLGCGSIGPAPSPSVCAPGATRACVCSNGTSGTQSCSFDGSYWLSCSGCGSGSGFCGDGRCGGGESCASCPSDCGRCGSSTCFANPGDACSADTDCCRDGASGAASRCTDFDGRVVCAATCAANSECVSGCCAARRDGVRVCSAASYCGAPTCTRQVNQSCTTDVECCPEASSRVPTRCTTVDGATTCRAQCSANSECASGCCARRNDGVFICAPASSCGAPTCTRQINQTCTDDAECCPDPVSRRRGRCTTADGVATCRAECVINSHCASGCCARRDDGVYICSPVRFCQ